MDPTLLLGVSVLGLVGFGVLFFVSLRWMREEKSGSKQGYKFGAGQPPQSAPPTPSASLQGSPSSHEVLRVLRDDLTGRVIVEIGGQRFNKIAEIQDPNIGRGFVTAVRDLQKFLQGQPTGSVPETAPAPRAAPTAPAPAPAPEPPHPSVVPPSTPPASAGTPSITMPSMNPFKQAQILREMSKQKPPEPKSIPEQIDEMLQAKILGTPVMRRGLMVKTGPTGSVLVMLDGQSYEGVEAVPDPEVQAVLRAAIKEWEGRQ